MSFWKILRVLVTNRCNLDCLFCHNEGQKKPDTLSDKEFLDSRLFRAVVRGLDNSGLSELRFSGGEPFQHPEIMDLIRWSNDHTSYELGCATNALLLSPDVVAALARTRIKLTINLPSVDPVLYSEVTSNGKLDCFFQAVQLLKVTGVQHSFNHVLHPVTLPAFSELLDYCIREGVNLKLLPYIPAELKQGDYTMIESVTALLDGKAYKKAIFRDRVTWFIESYRGVRTKVKYLMTPCLNGDFANCRSYAEVRLLPDGSVKDCQHRKSVSFDSSNALPFFQRLWNDFISC